MKTVSNRADEVRKATIQKLQEGGTFRTSTIGVSERIDETCARIAKDSGPLTITNIVEVFNQLFPNSSIGESTIRNKTASGGLYRGVIEAWRTCEFSKSHGRVTGKSLPHSAEIPDSLLNRIEPEEARLSVLLLRTALRNTITQLHVLQGLSPQRLIHGTDHDSSNATKTEEKSAAMKVSNADLHCVRAFIDEIELAIRGLSWGNEGQLVAVHQGACSGPGIKDALLKLLERVGSV
ncbi:hypothetical protein B0G80_2446 [Paraburkholderia sp. BL6669N2]|uniref:gamma-mobile-trio protein GmtX n=1 Tax=Paraburkholderia sp. BL6669N2 TaxID=1938807 RepID=UPI000E37794C|nr:gamma-mobile-trio protein GmtX [Paraburkholderia sp. BL6669N2]REG59675.1 hypothetical protein B0G80_2446 [Paraburkholderia sp. BL6669N2]